MNSGIRLKIPRIRYIDTGLPTDVKKAQKHVHEMLGHLGWKTIQRGLAQVEGCFRLKRVAPLHKCYIDLSGRINEESVLHKFHYYCSSVTRKDME